MTKPLLFLAALTLFFCIATLPAFARESCQCINYTTNPVPRAVIRRVVIATASGYCRRTEIIITTRKGVVLCAKPEMKWVNELITMLQRMDCGNRRAQSSVPRQ